MQVGELFVSLGVKGSDKTLSAVANVKTSMGDVVSTGLEAKAAIVAALYALERLMTGSAKAGANILNFSALTGFSEKSLQQYQYQAKQAGVAIEEMAGSIDSLGQKMVELYKNQGAPDGIAFLNRKMLESGKKGFDRARSQNIEYVMQWLREASQLKGVDPKVLENMIGSFGLSKGVIAAMMRGFLDPGKIDKAPYKHKHLLEGLSDANKDLAKLESAFERGFDKFTAGAGDKMIRDITDLVPKLFDLVNAVTALGEKLEVFKAIGNALDTTGKIAVSLTGTANAITGLMDDPKKIQIMKDGIEKAMAEDNKKTREMLHIKMPVRNPSTEPSQRTVNITHHNNFDGSFENVEENASHINRLTDNAGRDLSQGWGP